MECKLIIDIPCPKPKINNDTYSLLNAHYVIGIVKAFAYISL